MGDRLALFRALRDATPEQIEALLDEVGGRCPDVCIGRNHDEPASVTVRQDSRNGGREATFFLAMKRAQS